MASYRWTKTEDLVSYQGSRLNGRDARRPSLNCPPAHTRPQQSEGSNDSQSPKAHTYQITTEQGKKDITRAEPGKTQPRLQKKWVSILQSVPLSTQACQTSQARRLLATKLNTMSARTSILPTNAQVPPRPTRLPEIQGISGGLCACVQSQLLSQTCGRVRIFKNDLRHGKRLKGIG